MSRRHIRLGFADKWKGFVPEEDAYYKILARHYDITLSDDPDYMICSQTGHAHVKYDCIKILDVGENIVPDFNQFDYAVGFDHLDFGDRYLRVPLYVFSQGYKNLAGRSSPPPDEQLLSRKFCSFVVSNGNMVDPIRDVFFHELSKYKRVDSGGRHLNNIGSPVANKLEFCSQYKFNIAFENSDSLGYTTEKVMQPLSVFSVPIYWGNPLVEKDFLPDCMVRVKSLEDIERAVAEIVRLDKDDQAYLACAKAPCLAAAHDEYERRLETFLCHIIDQPMAQARRLNRYGFQPIVRMRQRRMHALDDVVKAPLCVVRQLMGKIR